MTDNKDHDLPTWLGEEFITEVLRKYESESELQVLELKVSPACSKGDHYASVMFRAEVKYKTGNGKFFQSLIVKAMPEQEGHMKDMLSESHVFDTEIGIYDKVMPMFKKILQQAGDNTKLNANCIYSSLEPRKVLIFEDLLPLGYNLISNRDFTHEEIRCVYAKLATWHAASMKILNEQPEILKEFKHGLFDMPTFNINLTSNFSIFRELLDEVPDLTKYKTYFEKIQETYVQDLEAVMKEYSINRQPDGFYVLSHGDLHFGNIMYKYNKENGAVDDCIPVDFQLCTVSPIVIDLFYSVYAIMGPEDRLYNLDKLLSFYFDSLLENLTKIGYKGILPTLDGFWQQIHKHKYFQFMLLTTFLPTAWAIKTKAFEIAELFGNEDVRRKSYRLDGVVNELKELLPRFEKLGYFKNL
ncbi:uncharacterized protein LOC111519423 [Drosophila willistoni]|uniref:uncharacterized protein LOC111519423 n=1 Tax=Drosophila willistoni TaxID=7260 RepID=UPI00017D971D|nr:uncharacterized protein LOC111519423 [Drosophila willistoni]